MGLDKKVKTHFNKNVSRSVFLIILAVLFALGAIFIWTTRNYIDTHLSFTIVFCVIIVYFVLYAVLTRNRILLLQKNELKAATAKLAESEYMLRTVFDQASIGIAIVKEYNFEMTKEANHPHINPMFEKILGRSEKELSDMDWKDITHPEDLQADLDYFRRFRAGEIDGYQMEKRFIRPDGSVVWVLMIISALLFNNESGFYHLCLITDITKNKELEKVLSDSEHSKSVLLDNLPGMMFRCKFDNNFTVLYISDGCRALTGYKPNEFTGQEISLVDIIDEKYRDTVYEALQKAISQGTKLSIEYEITTSNGGKKWVWAQGRAVHNESGAAEAIEGLMLDITMRKKNEIRLIYQNEHDSLTGLPNINLFNKALCNCEDIDVNRAVVLFNIRRFSILKSSFGYRFAQKLIFDVAVIISEFAEAEGLDVFQVSLDQFLIYSTNYNHREDIDVLCQKLTEKLERELPVRAASYNMGIVELDKGVSYDTDLLLKKTALAAENVSDSLRAGHCFFNKEMEEQHNRLVAIRQALTETANRENDDSLFMVYQPILNLKTGKIAGFEALARYKNKTLGFVSPGEFIPIAENYQLILPLGKTIMMKVFAFAVRLAKEGIVPPFHVSFNISAIQLLNDLFIKDMCDMLAATGADPKLLAIEITESFFFDNYQEVNKKLDEIRNLGIKISIDDFGTGFSSLAREKELKVNCLKIDKQFIDGLLIDTDRAITSDIISIAHKLGHYVVAEGVEHERQKQYLTEHRCDMLQGYLYSKPLEEEIALQFLQHHK